MILTKSPIFMFILFRNTFGFTPQGFLRKQNRYLSKEFLVPRPENQLLKSKLETLRSVVKRLKDQRSGDNGVFGVSDLGSLTKKDKKSVRTKKTILLVECDGAAVETARARQRKEVHRKKRTRRNRLFYTLMKLRTF